MNAFEERMLDILTFGRERGLYAGVKAEFGAEGTRTEEMIRLSDITRRAGLKLGIEIGGCEAARDLLDCKQIGADMIIAPMIESPYALSKFIEMKNRIYSPYERCNVDFLFNVETIHAFADLETILDKAVTPNGVNGVVFGRGDYAASCGVSPDSVNGEKITRDALEIAAACRGRKLDFAVGGGVALEAVDTLRKIHDVHLTRFETHKIMFDPRCFYSEHMTQGFIYAGEFELLWLKNKREYYTKIAGEDTARIDMLERRLKRQQAQTPSVKMTAVA